MVTSLLFQSIKRGALFLVTLGLCASYAAPGAGESNLITNSPFLPPGYGQKAPEPEPEPEIIAQGPLSRELEFRGIFEMNGVTKFSVFDKSEQKGQWIPLNGGDSKYTIVRYNEPKRSITVKSAGRLEEIFLHAADDKPMPVVGAASTTTNQRPNSRTNNTTNQQNGIANPRTNRTGTTVPRRRIIRRSSSSNNNNSTNAASSGSTSSSSQNSTPQLPSNIPPPPNFTPGPPPNFTPPPPPSTN